LNALSIFTTANPDMGITNEELNKWLIFNESAFSYSDIPHFNGQNVVLHGYYQSYKYFHKYRQQIFDLIRIYDYLEANRIEFNGYFHENTLFTISMHFRLGDYKDKEEFHPIMPYEYYESALKMAIKDGQHEDFSIDVLYFCEAEDNHYVKQIIQQLQDIHPKIYFQKVDDTIPDWKQMLIMSNCNANIIANSSFSWWGAYLSNSNRVYYPCKWFGPKLAHHCTDDLFMEDWTKIDFEKV